MKKYHMYTMEDYSAIEKKRRGGGEKGGEGGGGRG